MAVTAGEIIDVSLNAASTLSLTAFTGSDGITFPFDSANGQALLVLAGTHASNASVFSLKAGNHVQGASDLSVTVAAGAMATVAIDSARFVNVSGDNAGKILLKETGGTPKAALIRIAKPI